MLVSFIKRIKKLTLYSMLSKNLQKIKILFTLTLILVSGDIISQIPNNDTVYIDTTEYIPSFYKGALDYNLMVAASKGYVSEITRLINNGADIFAETDQGATPLIFAVSNNQTEVAKLLIDYGSDVNKVTTQTVTPLIIAVKNQNAEIAEALIREGADIDANDKYNATALHYASVYGYFQLVDLLLYYNASIDKKTIDGSTPLLASIWAGNADITDILIQNHANLETRDNEGFTPFLMAALNGDTLIMRLLFVKGADIYATNNSNHNALALTIIANQKDATQFLLKIGDKWAALENNAINPYIIASKYRRKDILKILDTNKIPGKIKYEIDQVDITASTRFFTRDIYTGVSLSFREPYLNGGIILGMDTKLWYTRVLIKQSEHLFFQYMDKGSLFYGGVFKDFSLTDDPFRGNFGLSASLTAGYSFGNELKGTLMVPANKFRIIPAISIVWTKKNLSFSLGADYLKSDFYQIGPIWLRFGASYNLYFDKVRTKGKTLKWY
jgi:ankyrin repeat protein